MAGVAFPDPTGNRAHEPLVARPPAPGQVTAVSYFFFQMPAGSETDDDQGCQFRPVAGHTYEYRSGFPFRIFVDDQSRIVGAQVVGTMVAEIFVAKGIPEALLNAMLATNREESARQAE